MNIYCSKIPMSWVDTKSGKIKFLEFRNLKEPKGTIYYGLRQGRPEGFDLSMAFDKAIVEAIKKVGGIKSNVIVIKGVTTTYSGKLWMKPQDVCEVIVIDGITKKPTFRSLINGKDDYSSVKKGNGTEESVEHESTEQMMEESYGIVGRIITEAMTIPSVENRLISACDETASLFDRLKSLADESSKTKSFPDRADYYVEKLMEHMGMSATFASRLKDSLLDMKGLNESLSSDVVHVTGCQPAVVYSGGRYRDGYYSLRFSDGKEVTMSFGDINGAAGIGDISEVVGLSKDDLGID